MAPVLVGYCNSAYNLFANTAQLIRLAPASVESQMFSIAVDPAAA
jgi:hypothetical protein